MLDFINKRIDFLNTIWIGKEDYCTITLKTLNKQYRFYCVTPGTVCYDLPSPEEFGLKGVTHWQYEDSGELLSYDTPVYEDIDLIAYS